MGRPRSRRIIYYCSVCDKCWQTRRLRPIRRYTRDDIAFIGKPPKLCPDHDKIQVETNRLVLAN